jgi:membrane associated rhomboid family serine protease
MTAWDRGEAVRNAMIAGGGAPITWSLLVLLILVFCGGLTLAVQRGVTVTEYLTSGRSPVMNRFAVFTAAVRAGEWWRLLTYSAVHGGAMHLLMNGIALMALGPFLERALGPVRFLLLWLLGALGGGVAAVLAGPNPTVGASGALCALLAAAVVFIWLNRRHLGPRASSDALRRLSTGILLTALISFSPGISWAGHLGGAVAGLVGGVLLTYHRFGTAEQRWAALLGLVLFPIAGLAPLVEKGILRHPRNRRPRSSDGRSPTNGRISARWWVRRPSGSVSSPRSATTTSSTPCATNSRRSATRPELRPHACC